MATLAAQARAVPRPALWPLAAACAMALQALLVLTHQPWMDEWQALQVALGTPDLASLLNILHYEGHPPLWYLLLRGAALVVPGPWVLPAVLLPIALATQGLVLRLPMLPRWERLALALNATLLIEAGSISRSFSLGALLLILAFTSERRATRWIAIALLPMADFLFGLLSIIAIAREWREDGRLWKPGLLLWGTLSLLAALSVVPAADMAPAMPPDDMLLQTVRFIVGLAPQLVPVQMIGPHLVWGGTWHPLELAGIGGPLFLLFGAFLLRDVPFERALFLAFAAICFAISLFLYWLSPRHLALIGMLLVLLRIRAGYPPARQRALWRAWLAAGAAGGLLGAALVLVQPFDSGRAMSREIARRHLEGDDIVGWQSATVQGIAVPLGREFTSLSRGCTEGFHLWDRHRGPEGRDGLHRALADYAARNGHFYLVTDLGIETGKVAVPMRQLAFVAHGYDGYDYHLYELAWDRPRRVPLPRPCAPTRIPAARWYGDYR